MDYHDYTETELAEVGRVARQSIRILEAEHLRLLMQRRHPGTRSEIADIRRIEADIAALRKDYADAIKASKESDEAVRPEPVLVEFPQPRIEE